MTDSRETVRRKAFRDHASAAANPSRPVPLTDLCIIHACINPRIGPNLCRDHADELDNQ